jgi:hypothetical protein
VLGGPHFQRPLPPLPLSISQGKSTLIQGRYSTIWEPLLWESFKYTIRYNCCAKSCLETSGAKGSRKCGHKGNRNSWCWRVSRQDIKWCIAVRQSALWLLLHEARLMSCHAFFGVGIYRSNFLLRDSTNFTERLNFILSDWLRFTFKNIPMKASDLRVKTLLFGLSYSQIYYKINVNSLWPISRLICIGSCYLYPRKIFEVALLFTEMQSDMLVYFKAYRTRRDFVRTRVAYY